MSCPSTACVITTCDLRHGAAYTGADAAFYEPSKAVMKQMAHYAGVPTAPWAIMMHVDMQVLWQSV
jgi:hypothetical protein